MKSNHLTKNYLSKSAYSSIFSISMLRHPLTYPLTCLAFVLCLGSLFLALYPPKQAYAIDFNPAEKATLIAIGTDNDPQGNLNWETTPTEVKGWEGVEWVEVDGEYRVHSIEARGKGLTGAMALSRLNSLVELVVEYNQITSLDVSQNPALNSIKANDNKLTSLDVSKNTDLLALSVTNNLLTSLDISHN
ncbi:MAG: hypothetical protein LBF58_07880, partial [Deltaproteobacteria bacterium]|nr:hypothetical protein [Deltaproteobacteria bacterium]